MPERICQTFHRGIVQPLQCKTGENFQGKPDDQGTGCALSILENNFDTMEEKEREILSGLLFSCLTGLRYSDICSVEYSNIKRIRNKRWLFLTMKKTSQKVFIPIEQMFSGKALGIIKLFHRTRGKLFHMPSNAICNRVIKRVYKKFFAAGKTFPFTSRNIVKIISN